MSPIKEPKNTEFSKKICAMDREEHLEFRKIMQEIKLKNEKPKQRALRVKN